VLRLRPHTFYDRQGWGQPVEAFSMLLPSDWRVRGEVVWKGGSGAPSCMNSDAQLILEARSPDGLWGFDILPAPTLYWLAVQQSAAGPYQIDLNQTMVRPQLQKWASEYHRPGSVCRVTPSTGAAALLQEAVLPVWRPQSRIQSVEDLPEVRRQYQELVGDRLGAGPNTVARADAAIVRILTPTPAGPVEEGLVVMSIARAARLYGHDNVTTQQTVLGRPIFLARYPVGRKAEAEQVFATISGSLRTSPRWQAAMNQHAAVMSRIATQGAIDRAQIWARTAREISDMQMAGWKRRQDSSDRMQRLVVDQIREVQPVRDPTDGTVYELSNHYSSYFTNRNGEILMSTNPVLNPADVFPNEDWTRMEPSRR